MYDGHCIADRMASEGVCQTPAHKDVGSRQSGWELLRERLKNVMKPDALRLFVFSTCRRFICAVPVLPATTWIGPPRIRREARPGIGC